MAVFRGGVNGFGVPAHGAHGGAAVVMQQDAYQRSAPTHRFHAQFTMKRESTVQRAESREQRAESREQRAVDARAALRIHGFRKEHSSAQGGREVRHHRANGIAVDDERPAGKLPLMNAWKWSGGCRSRLRSTVAEAAARIANFGGRNGRYGASRKTSPPTGTVHQAKGESLDAVLYVATKDHVQALLAGVNTEVGRIGYVAVTRAKTLFWLGVPANAVKELRPALLAAGFQEADAAAMAKVAP
jgi:hypothetical protein